MPDSVLVTSTSTLESLISIHFHPTASAFPVTGQFETSARTADRKMTFNNARLKVLHIFSTSSKKSQISIRFSCMARAIPDKYTERPKNNIKHIRLEVTVRNDHLEIARQRGTKNHVIVITC